MTERWDGTAEQPQDAAVPPPPPDLEELGFPSVLQKALRVLCEALSAEEPIFNLSWSLRCREEGTELKRGGLECAASSEHLHSPYYTDTTAQSWGSLLGTATTKPPMLPERVQARLLRSSSQDTTAWKSWDSAPTKIRVQLHYNTLKLKIGTQLAQA